MGPDNFFFLVGAWPLLLYHASLAKREVIDAQLDTWLEQEVIELSNSPWGAPVIIVTQNGKHWLCVDWRKLNELTVPDEFPNTMPDTLSGFTQLEFEPSSPDKTAFRTHHRLFQFLWMPFSWRNGPPVFQRVMQAILATHLGQCEWDHTLYHTCTNFGQIYNIFMALIHISDLTLISLIFLTFPLISIFSPFLFPLTEHTIPETAGTRICWWCHDLGRCMILGLHWHECLFTPKSGNSHSLDIRRSPQPIRQLPPCQVLL